MRKILALLTTMFSFACCTIWVFSSCTPQDEFGDDYVAREYDEAIKKLPNQNIPLDLCGAWKKVGAKKKNMYPEDLIITSEGKISGFYSSVEIVGLCYFNFKHLMWRWKTPNSTSSDAFAVAIYWDSDALILGTWFSFVGIYSRGGEPVDSKIFSNRDPRLIGCWKIIGGSSRIVYNSDGSGSFNGANFTNWCTIGDYVVYQFYGDELYWVDAYRFFGDLVSFDSVDPTDQNWSYYYTRE